MQEQFVFIDSFTGNVSLWSSHDDIDTIAQDMNTDLSLMSSWGRNNDLKFGLKKCKVMWFQKKRAEFLRNQNGR